MAHQYDPKNSGKGKKANALHKRESRQFLQKLLYRSSQTKLLELQTAS